MVLIIRVIVNNTYSDMFMSDVIKEYIAIWQSAVRLKRI